MAEASGAESAYDFALRTIEPGAVIRGAKGINAKMFASAGKRFRYNTTPRPGEAEAVRSGAMDIKAFVRNRMRDTASRPVVEDAQAFIRRRKRDQDPKHVQSYLDEFCWRFNRRQRSEEERFDLLLAACLDAPPLTKCALTGGYRG